MRFKVELADGVYDYLRHDCSVADVDDFFQKKKLLESDPIRHSELHVGERKGKRAVRRFRFGRGVVRIAIFDLNASGTTARITRCRNLEPKEFTRGTWPGRGPSQS